MSRALYTQLRKQSTLLKHTVLPPLDRLNKILQGSRCIVSKLVNSVQLNNQLLQEHDEAEDSIQGFLRKMKASNCDTLDELPRQKYRTYVQLVSRESESRSF